jgi:molybdopterin-containing oxidoreductase family membrane subunit
VLVGLGIPFAILVVKRWRARPALVAVAAVLGVFGIFVHRLNLLLNGLSYVPISLPPGVGIGTPQDGVSFATYNWYVPTIVEWLIVIGVLAFGALLFTLAGLYLPLRERAGSSAGGA